MPFKIILVYLHYARCFCCCCSCTLCGWVCCLCVAGDIYESIFNMECLDLDLVVVWFNKVRHFCVSIIARVMIYGMCLAQVVHVEMYRRDRISKSKISHVQKCRLCIYHAILTELDIHSYAASLWLPFSDSIQTQWHSPKCLTKLTKITLCQTFIQSLFSAIPKEWGMDGILL